MSEQFWMQAGLGTLILFVFSQIVSLIFLKFMKHVKEQGEEHRIERREWATAALNRQLETNQALHDLNSALRSSNEGQASICRFTPPHGR